MKKYLFLSVIIASLSALPVNCTQAEDFSPIKILSPESNITPSSEIKIDLSAEKQAEIQVIELNQNDIFHSVLNATDKFVQCNIQSAWEDFQKLLNQPIKNDFIYISTANKMAEMGLFDLAHQASLNVQDKQLGQISLDAMKRFYYPRKRLKLEDELFLAEIYSNILYNDQSSEATNELLKNSALLSSSDYANYLVALGSYKSGVFPRANQYIDLAIIQNPTNLNYQKLKAEILSDNKKPAEAIKLVESLKKQNLIAYEYERKIKSLEQYVLYKAAVNDCTKNYHLAFYYYLENDPSKAARTLQNAMTSKKKGDKDKIYSLLSKIYLEMNEFEKAADSAQKAYKLNKNNPITLICLGDLESRKKNYKAALKYYKDASSKDKLSYYPLVKEAQTYQKLSNIKKAKEIYEKILKTHSDCWEAYFYTAMLDKDKEIIYIKKALAINPLFKDGWIELAKLELERANYDLTEKYLANAFYIDENDFRYYYYQGLVNKNLGDLSKAEYNFKKCLKLNPNHQEAQKELSR